MTPPPKTSKPALSTSELTKNYGERPALEPLTLEVAHGQHVALVGHNGSGKTTMMKMIAGVLDASGGSASIYGKPSGSHEARRMLSWLSDTPVFYDDLSLNEHLEYVARLHGLEEWQGKAERLLAEVGLAERADDLPVTFSRGLRQKAAITLAFIRPFQLMLVDEPFIGLDAAGKKALMGLFAEAGDNGATLVVATHELSFVTSVQRLLALRDGVLTYDGAPAATDVNELVRPA